MTYDVRPGGGAGEPHLLLIGSPMGAGGFGTLAGHFPDRTVVTYDPRGVERSTKTDPATESTPEQHADDLHRIIAALDAGPVDLFASSGGAVNALALVAAHPDDVRTLVAHEPPLASILPDRDGAMAFTAAIGKTYQQSGFGPAMAQFILAVGHRGPDDGGVRRAARPGPGDVRPAERGRREPDRSPALPEHRHLYALRARRGGAPAASTRIVLAAGAESEGQMARRGAEAMAELLGTAPVIFPSDHGGFLGGEYGQAGEPDAFAAKLREVLTDA